MLDISRLAFVLTVITFIAGLAIGWTNSLTKDAIVKQEQLAETEALSAVFPEGTKIESFTGNAPLPSRYWVGKKGTDIVGYAFQDSSKGFEKDIKVVVGVGLDGTILGINILAQKETPGLGVRVTEVASHKFIWKPTAKIEEDTRPWFTSQFAGLDINKKIGINKIVGEWHSLNKKSKDELIASNSITAITGATISSRAVVRAVTKSIPQYLEILKNKKAELEADKGEVN